MWLIANQRFVYLFVWLLTEFWLGIDAVGSTGNDQNRSNAFYINWTMSNSLFGK